MQRPVTYSLNIEEQEDGYLAYFPALPGCHTWGRSYEDAVQRAKEALTGYLETLVEHGDSLPEEDTSAPVSLAVTVHALTR